jgi:uncharacterized protein YbjT (DUF2867 family)
VTDALLVRRARIRALVRDPGRSAARQLADRGVEVVAGSLSDPGTLAAAMKGVAGVFAFTAPFEAGVEAEVDLGRAILAAAAQERVPHLVFSSVAGADQDSGVPHFESKARIEAELAAGDVPHTILGPTYFFDKRTARRAEIMSPDSSLPEPGPSRTPLRHARGVHPPTRSRESAVVGGSSLLISNVTEPSTASARNERAARFRFA